MQHPKLLLRPGKEHLMNRFHPWLFSQALQNNHSVSNGTITDIYSSDGKRFFARGYYNGNSQIAVRILTRDISENIDTAFFEKRFHELLYTRERFINTAETNAFRIVFGESDALPGLVIDKYDQVYVVQIHTLGMELLKKNVIAAMESVFKPKTIFERSDIRVRQQEGLTEMPVQHLKGEKITNEIRIKEHGIEFLVNVKEGQKTGFFLDQRDNRKALQKYVAGKRILNCFCYSSGFSVYAALAGAKSTCNVDVSEEALETAKRNFTLNNIPLKQHSFLEEDVFDMLGNLKKQEQFDIIILDPPAFVKNQKSLKKGLSGYLFINGKALALLPKGGILVSSSCSAHVTDEMFQKMLAMAATNARCTLKTLEIRHQPIDHPFNPQFPEGKYLKFYIMLKQ